MKHTCPFDKLTVSTDGSCDGKVKVGGNGKWKKVLRQKDGC